MRALSACECAIVSVLMYKPYHHSIFLHTNSEKSGKCQHKPTQTATTSKKKCRRPGPLWPKLERHGVSSATCRDMSATFPAKIPASCILLRAFSCARGSSKVPLVMTSRSSMYACTYSRASLGPLFLYRNIGRFLLDCSFLWYVTGK